MGTDVSDGYSIQQDLGIVPRLKVDDFNVAISIVVFYNILVPFSIPKSQHGFLEIVLDIEKEKKKKISREPTHPSKKETMDGTSSVNCLQGAPVY